jgi:hypothetical protein
LRRNGGAEKGQILEGAPGTSGGGAFRSGGSGTGRRDGGVDEGGDDAAKWVVRGLAPYVGLQHAGLDGPGAAQASIRGSHFFDHVELHVVGRLDAVDVLLEEGLKAVAGFVAQENTAGEEAVTEGVWDAARLPAGVAGPWESAPLARKKRFAKEGCD